MRWTAKHLRKEPDDGFTRVFIKFAWFPVYIAGVMVWFEQYETLKVYRITEQKVTINDEKFIFMVGKWVKLANKCK